MGNENLKAKRESPVLTDEEVETLKANTCYSGDEIKDFHAKFLEVCPKGEFDKKAFVKYFSELRPDRNTEFFVTQLFNAFDSDNSGKVDFKEFLLAISFVSDKDSKQKLRFAFKMYDIDRDGQLSLKELEKLVIGIYEFTGQKNMSGSDDPKEKAKQMLKKLNKDENEYITEDEFVDEIILFPTLHALMSFSILRDGFSKV